MSESHKNPERSPKTVTCLGSSHSLGYALYLAKATKCNYFIISYGVYFDEVVCFDAMFSGGREVSYPNKNQVCRYEDFCTS